MAPALYLLVSSLRLKLPCMASRIKQLCVDRQLPSNGVCSAKLKRSIKDYTATSWYVPCVTLFDSPLLKHT
eukprot:scaffold662667_cov50-Prasinocladus_malaysianus.AAC.2